jgi:hypothetical protein
MGYVMHIVLEQFSLASTPDLFAARKILSLVIWDGKRLIQLDWIAPWRCTRALPRESEDFSLLGRLRACSQLRPWRRNQLGHPPSDRRASQPSRDQNRQFYFLLHKALQNRSTLIHNE